MEKETESVKVADILESVREKLKEISKELFDKFGADSYDIRCKLFDIYNPLYKAEYTPIIETKSGGGAPNSN